MVQLYKRLFIAFSSVLVNLFLNIVIVRYSGSISSGPVRFSRKSLGAARNVVYINSVSIQ